MREIKFRAKAEINNNFVYGHYFEESGKHKIHTGHTLYTVFGDTVGQFTGLKDKNGKEIYEGDIVKSTYFNYSSKSFVTIQQIKFSRGGFVAISIDDSGVAELPEFYNSHTSLYLFTNPTPNKIEIIGNIYENPELLKIEP